jgi:hypothetical protein
MLSDALTMAAAFDSVILHILLFYLRYHWCQFPHLF